MKNLASYLNPKNTPQTKPLPGTNQVQNNAGGFVHQIDKFAQLRRFLILGSVGGTYYVSEEQMTVENAKVVLDCLAENATKTFNLIEEVSGEGYAPKNDYAILALAIAYTVKTPYTDRRKLCFSKIVRTGTHLFQFVDAVNEVRGWGHSLRKTVQSWYTTQERDNLAYQLMKYRNREGWTHKDVLRMCHVRNTEANNDLRRWVVKGEVPTENVPRILEGFFKVQTEKDKKQAAAVIREYRLPHEAVPTELQAHPEVLEALLAHMNIGATVRQLARLTKAGVLKMGSNATKLVVDRITNQEAIEKSRIHPANYMLALLTYNKGEGFTPVAKISEAIETGFYRAYKNVTPSGKNFLMGVDVSGSMGMGTVAGIKGILPREAAAVSTLMTIQSEENVQTMAFSRTFMPLNFNKRTSLADINRKMSGLDFTTTDCSLPMVYATKNKLPIDAFVVMTDNETYAGQVHPTVALKNYEQAMGRPAKLIVQAFTATKFSIADPNNRNMLDVVGMDSSTPKVLSDFVAGNI